MRTASSFNQDAANLQKAVNAALQSESLAAGKPLSLELTLNGQRLRVQLQPVQDDLPNAKPQANPKSASELEQEAKRAYFSRLDELRAEERTRKANEIESQVCNTFSALGWLCIATRL
jgi:hypothetical protein